MAGIAFSNILLLSRLLSLGLSDAPMPLCDYALWAVIVV
jgi:hypothetical protein